MAEFERSLIQERVKAGLRNMRAEGKNLGRPRAVVDGDQIAALRTSGASWREISKRLHVPLGTVYRDKTRKRSKNPLEVQTVNLLIQTFRIGKFGRSINM